MFNVFNINLSIDMKNKFEFKINYFNIRPKFNYIIPK